MQDMDAKYTMKEVLNVIKVNKYKIKICIKLKTGQIINYKFNL